MPTVIVVRHGETDWNRERRIQGWAPTRLNDRGREQAAALGDHLAADHAVSRIVTSDLDRTLETARIIAERFPGTEPEPSPDWRERDFGAYQGLRYEELFGRFPEFALGENGADAASVVPEGGESLLDMRDRVVAGWERLLAETDPGETALVVTHGGPLRVLVGRLCGRGLVESVLEADQDNCAINEVRVDDGAVGHDAAGDGVGVDDGAVEVVCENRPVP